MPTTFRNDRRSREPAPARVALPRLISLLALCLGTSSCRHEAPTDATSLDVDDEPLATWVAPALADAPFELVVPTYDGSGQSVHPDVVAFANGWNGAKYWMAMTPFPNGAASVENPSLLVTDDGVTLALPDGVTNPIVPPIATGGYNSDPDLTFDYARDELVLSYRVVKDGQNIIKIMTSQTGRSWSEPRVAFSEAAHSAVSQSIVTATRFQPAMAWYVDAGPAGCSTTSTRVLMRRAKTTGASLGQTEWSNAVPTDMAQPGYVIWHLKVRYVPAKREYWALIVAFPADGRGCGGDDLFLAHSKTGFHWEGFAQPVMRHQDRSWTKLALYRGSFVYDADHDDLSMWFSARSETGRWRMGFAHFRYAGLAAELALAPARFSRFSAPPEREVWTDAP